MNIKDKLKNSRGYSLFEKILLISATSVLGGIIAFVPFYKQHVKRNLAPNAVYAPYAFSQRIFNEDLDKDGKYETVLESKLEGKTKRFLFQYNNEKGYPIIKPYKIETQYDSLTNKESKTIKILEEK